MKQSKFSIICKIILILSILYTPFRYASRAHKTAQRIEVLSNNTASIEKHIEITKDSIKTLQADIAKMQAEVKVMSSHIDKKIR